MNIHNAITFMDHVMWGGVIDWAVLNGEGYGLCYLGRGYELDFIKGSIPKPVATLEINIFQN